MKVFVTGSAGFVGRNLLEHLDKRSDVEGVYALMRRAPAHPPPGRVEPLVGDLEGIGRFARELRECGLVFHLAADASPSAGAGLLRTNVEGCRALLAAIGDGPKLEKLVFTSSILAAGRRAGDRCRTPIGPATPATPTTPYGRSKLACEDELRASGLPHVAFRPPMVYGRGMREDSHLPTFARWVRQRTLAARVDYPGRVSLIHVEDLCHAMVESRRSTGSLFLAATETLRLGDVLALLERRIHGGETRRWPLPGAAFLLRRLHGLTGYGPASAFTDYLWADDPAFLEAFFRDRTPARLAERLDDVVTDDRPSSAAAADRP